MAYEQESPWLCFKPSYRVLHCGSLFLVIGDKLVFLQQKIENSKKQWIRVRFYVRFVND